MIGIRRAWNWKMCVSLCLLKDVTRMLCMLTLGQLYCSLDFTVLLLLMASSISTNQFQGPCRDCVASLCEALMNPLAVCVLCPLPYAPSQRQQWWLGWLADIWCAHRNTCLLINSLLTTFKLIFRWIDMSNFCGWCTAWGHFYFEIHKPTKLTGNKNEYFGNWW